MIELTEQQDHRLHRGNCPFCNGTRFLHGPCGGGSENIRCKGCGKEFCFAPPFKSLVLDRDEPGIYSGEFSLKSEVADIRDGLDAMFGRPIGAVRPLWQAIRPYALGATITGLAMTAYWITYILVHARR